jgi:radical SAM superfamily enzyme YgiQ (UPF0313 family)
MNLGILKIGAVLEQAGYEVDHLDLTGMSNYEVAVVNYQHDAIFAITATTPQMPAAMQIRKLLRGKVILGGSHATLIHAAASRGSERAQETLQELLDTFDCVVAGDGEKAIIVALNESGLIDADNPQSLLWQTSREFSESPWPARHLVDVDSYRYNIEGKRALSMIS